MNKNTLLVLFLISSITLWKSNTYANQKYSFLSDNRTSIIAFDQDDLAKKQALKAEQKRAKQIEKQKKALEKAHKQREKKAKKYQEAIKKTNKLEKQIVKQESSIEKLEVNLQNKISGNKISDIQIHKENIKISKAKIKLKKLKKELDDTHDDILKFEK